MKMIGHVLMIDRHFLHCQVVVVGRCFPQPRLLLHLDDIHCSHRCSWRVGRMDYSFQQSLRKIVQGRWGLGTLLLHRF